MNEVTKSPVLTIDGPSGAGKGTVCQLVARELGWHLLDSGALYRLTAVAADHHGVDIENEAALEVLAKHLDVQFQPSDSGIQVILEGEEVTDAIRTEEVGAKASKVAAFPLVREALLQRQRDFEQAPGLVADGRDMGTVVFPEAQVKVFLTASAEERAERRFKQLKDKGLDVNLRAILEDVQARDERDANRAVAPLKPAQDALVIDSTEMTIQQVVDTVLTELRKHAVI